MLLNVGEKVGYKRRRISALLIENCCIARGSGFENTRVDYLCSRDENCYLKRKADTSPFNHVKTTVYSTTSS